jgi:hypothetical protein
VNPVHYEVVVTVVALVSVGCVSDIHLKVVERIAAWAVDSSNSGLVSVFREDESMLNELHREIVV